MTYSGYGVAFDEFTQEIINQKADAAIVYFAGHGLNIDGTDYLIMKDTPAFKTGESKTKKESVAINNICQELNAIGDQLNILILDACRDDPNHRHLLPIQRLLESPHLMVMLPRGTVLTQRLYWKTLKKRICLLNHCSKG